VAEAGLTLEGVALGFNHVEVECGTPLRIDDQAMASVGS
jgi:hypothetical protein